MNSELLGAIAGVVISLAFSYVPGLKFWFGELEGDYKRLVMLGALAIVALGAFGLACLGQYSGVACTQAGAWDLIYIFIAAAIANQSAYMLTPNNK